MIETDVRITTDGELFLFHDETGLRTTNVARVYPRRAEDPITSFSAGELRRLDAGAHFGGRFTGERIMFLSDLPAAVGFTMGINLELKSPARSPGIERELAAALASQKDWLRLQQDRQVVISSFDQAAASAFSSAAPAVPVWQLVDRDPDHALLASGAPRLRGIVANHRRLTPRGAALVRAAGLGLSVYTVNTPADTAAALALGVDALITDFPGRVGLRLPRTLRRGVPPAWTNAAGRDGSSRPRGKRLLPWTGSGRSVRHSR